MAGPVFQEDGVQYAAPGEKLTDWAKEPALSELKSDLEAAKQSHDQHVTNVNRWTDLRDVTGTARPAKIKGRSQVQPKLIRRQAEWRYSALTEALMSAPHMVRVLPVTFEDTKGARQNQLLLNWQFRTKINRVKFIDDYVRSVVDEGTTIVRVGWQRETRKIKEMVPVFEYVEMAAQEELDAFRAAYELKLTNPRDYDVNVPPELKAAIDYYDETQVLSVARQVDEEEQEIEKVYCNQPTLAIRDIRNVVIDPSCEGDLDKALFVVDTFETNRAELEKSSIKYKNLDKVLWDGVGKVNDPDHNTNTPDTFNFRDKARKKTIAHEYWGFYDIDGDGILTPIVATWIGNVLIRLEKNPYPDQKLPFVLVPYNPKKRELHGEPDAELLEDHQKIMGALTRGMLDLLGRSANAQHGYAKGALDALNRRRYEAGLDYEFNPVAAANQVMIEHKYPEIPNSALQMLQLQNQDAEALSGVKSFSGGLSGNAYGDVAAGIKGMLDASAKREMSILRRLAKGIIDIARKMSSMNAEFLSDEEIVRVTNKDPNEEGFIRIKREDLPGEYDYDTDISTTEADNAKAIELSTMLQTMGPNMDPMLAKEILADIADLKRMPELAERLRRWQPTPDPLAEKVKQLEIMKLEKEIAEIDSRAALNAAKAEEASSKADLNTLDFVEQEKGVKHLREMDRVQGQAAGNQELEVTKALLKNRKLEEIPGDIEAAIGWNALSQQERAVV